MEIGKLQHFWRVIIQNFVAQIMDKNFIKGFSFAIDRGGTFTDVFARTPTGKSIVMKLLSEDPANYPDAPREGIRRILEQVSFGNEMIPS